MLLVGSCWFHGFRISGFDCWWVLLVTVDVSACLCLIGFVLVASCRFAGLALSVVVLFCWNVVFVV